MSPTQPFDLWLEGQLRSDLLPITTAHPPRRPRYASSRPGVSPIRLSLATALAVAALLATGTGALAATMTGSVDPRVWVERVGDLSRKHGPGAPAAHPATQAREQHPARDRAPNRGADRDGGGDRDTLQAGPDAISSPPAQDPASGKPGERPDGKPDDLDTQKGDGKEKGPDSGKDKGGDRGGDKGGDKGGDRGGDKGRG